MSDLSDTYFTWLHQQQIIKYCRVAPISIWVFDYFLTLDHEVQLLSRKEWGLPHILYIPTRYCALFGSLCAAYNALMPSRPAGTCVALYRAAEVVLFVGMVAAEGLLLIRTLALWRQSTIATRFLTTIYAMAAVVMFVCTMISTTLKFEGICSETTASIATETATKLSQVTVGMFSSAAFFELVVVAYTLRHGARLRANGGSTKSRLVAAVTQGNLLYAVSLFTTSIANITFFVLPLRYGWNGLLATFQGILHSVMASRILFGLQTAVEGQGEILQFSATNMEFVPIHISTQHNTNP